MVPILIICLVSVPVPELNSEHLLLFADDPAYRTLNAIEARYEGHLEYVPAQPGVPGRYRLVVSEGDGKTHPYELNLPRPVAGLSTHAGQPVRLVGKLTDRGLWPGRLESIPRVGGASRDGILARSVWQPSATRKISRTLQTFVFRTGEQAAPHLGLSGSASAEAAGRFFARDFRLPELDWPRQMVVCVAAGLKTDVERLLITRTVIKDGTLTVHYRMLKLPEGKAHGFGYPAETVLLPRFDGNIRFEEEVPK